jgi:hypothetical protein
VVLVALVSIEAAGFNGETRIQGMSAHLYYQETGTIDPRDLISGKLVLWNTIIGAGDARASSVATYVLVELQIDRQKPPKTLEFKARAGEKILAEKSMAVGDFFTDTSAVVIPFIVYGTGCQALELTARLAGDATPRGSLTRTVNFACGE